MNELIPRDAVKYICRKKTVSTNPDDYKHSNQFMDFMDDDAVADFGRWQWANGFNTALVTVEVELAKLPSAQERTGRWIYDGCDHPHGVEWCHCSICGNRDSVDSVYTQVNVYPYCAKCGAHMIEVEHDRNER